jgi:hypothetical protein
MRGYSTKHKINPSWEHHRNSLVDSRFQLLIALVLYLHALPSQHPVQSLDIFRVLHLEKTPGHHLFQGPLLNLHLRKALVAPFTGCRAKALRNFRYLRFPARNRMILADLALAKGGGGFRLKIARIVRLRAFQ